MVKLIRLLALLGAISVVGLWVFRGAHRGWSQTKIPLSRIDPVTEIEYTVYEEGFVPGVDFLAAGLGGAGILLAVSMIIAKLKRNES